MAAALEIYRRLSPFLAIALLPLALLLAIEKGETRHWHKQSDQYEKLYHDEHAAHAATIANYRGAAVLARQLDQANAARVKAEAGNINERIVHDYETRIADARARAASLERVRAGTAATDPRRGGATPVPGAGADRPQAAQAAGQDRLPPSDALTATEQAIQLDALIKAVTGVQAIDVNGHDAKPEPGQ